MKVDEIKRIKANSETYKNILLCRFHMNRIHNIYKVGDTWFIKYYRDTKRMRTKYNFPNTTRDPFNREL